LGEEEKLNPNYLKIALYLQEDSCGFSTWCLTVNNGYVQVLQKLWGWAEELQLTTDELHKLLLAEHRDGSTPIYWAASKSSTELLEKMWGVCKETQVNPDDLSKLLVAAWHGAAAGGHLVILERLWM